MVSPFEMIMIIQPLVVEPWRLYLCLSSCSWAALCSSSRSWARVACSCSLPPSSCRCSCVLRLRSCWFCSRTSACSLLSCWTLESSLMTKQQTQKFHFHLFPHEEVFRRALFLSYLRFGVSLTLRLSPLSVGSACSRALVLAFSAHPPVSRSASAWHFPSVTCASRPSILLFSVAFRVKVRCPYLVLSFVSFLSNLALHFFIYGANNLVMIILPSIFLRKQIKANDKVNLLKWIS